MIKRFPIAARSATFLALGLALSWPSTAAVSQETVSDPVVQAVPPSFADHFPELPDPATQPIPAAGAVDVTTIDPPIEVIEEDDEVSIGAGTASYYGKRFHGRRTASGEAFDMFGMTAAHRTLPFGTRLRVTNPRTGASVVVRVNDRGPFSGNRLIDLSRAAAQQIGLIQRGHGRVELARID